MFNVAANKAKSDWLKFYKTAHYNGNKNIKTLVFVLRNQQVGLEDSIHMVFWSKFVKFRMMRMSQ